MEVCVTEKKTDTVDTLIDDIQRFYEDADAKLEAGIKKERHLISCLGCTTPHCCYQKLLVSFWDVLPLARFLNNSDQVSATLLKQLAELGPRMEGSSSSAWFDERIPCVFLQDDKCAIYPYRPMECRTQYVVSPPKDCGEPGGKLVKTIDDEPLLNIALAYGRGVHKVLGLKETEMRVLMGAMPRVLSIALHVFGTESDHRGYIRRQVWPSQRRIDEGWFDGDNPFSERASSVQ
jgi:Fe-S-cluster containining protein